MYKIEFLVMLKGIVKILFKIIIFLICFSILFVPYNIFLGDQVLDELRFFLNQIDNAYGMNEIAGLDILLIRNITQQILSSKLTSNDLMGLEFTKNILTSGQNYRQLDYAKTTLGDIIKRKEDERGIVFTVLDNLNSILKKWFVHIIHYPQYIKKHKIEPVTRAGLDLLAEAEKLETDNKLQEAASSYDDFIKKYPNYENIASVKLRLAYSYHRTKEFDKARSIYKNIINSYSVEKEADIAQSLLTQLNQRGELTSRMNYLLSKIASLSDEDKEAKQQIFYEIGVINAGLFDFAEAKKFFKRAYNINPDNELGQKALFNSAWLSKESGDLEESISEFTSLANKKTNTALALDTLLQIADLDHKQGHFEEAINIYLRIADEHKGEPIAPLCLFQAAASYLYDLNNEEKSKEIFNRLIKEYPNSPYSKYLAPQNPVGLFLTYVLPRATRLVSWRAGGLICLTGYSGEAAKFAMLFEEKGFNLALNDWIRREFPDTVGNLYFDMKGVEVDFLKDKVAIRGRLVMGKFDVPGKAEFRLELSKENRLDFKITKTFLGKIPLPPFLINNAISGIFLIYRKNFPIIVEKIAMDKGELSIEGFGSKRMLMRLNKASKELLGIDMGIQDIKDPGEQEKIYGFLNKEFPENGFSPTPKEDAESLFLDFFTRMYLYSGFKLLETVKDSKLDYERSIRTLGSLQMKRIKFGVNYSEADINSSLDKYITNEFPWLVNDEFLYDIKGLEFHFTEKGEIGFSSHIVISAGGPPAITHDMKVEGQIVLEIDNKTGLPRVIFKEINLDGKPYPVEKLNLVTLRGFNLEKDGNLPFRLKEVRVNESMITLKGDGAQDFLARIFSDPYLFVIFQIRHWDLMLAGIQRLKVRPKDIGDFWRGRGYEHLKEVPIIGGKTGETFKQYKQ